jgi:hypothetical protein
MTTCALIVAIGGMVYFLPLGLTHLIVVRLLLGVGEASLWDLGLAPRGPRDRSCRDRVRLPRRVVVDAACAAAAVTVALSISQPTAQSAAAH